MSRFNLVYHALLCFSFAYLTPNLLISQSLVINEFMASNSSTILDESGAYDDWVEIHNPSDSAVDMAGMFLTDDLTEPTKCQIPTGFPDSTTIEANGYKLFWFDKEPEQGPLHIDTKLKASGEQIGLYASDTSVIDTLSYGVQSADISYGRLPGDSTAWAYFTVTTPGAANYIPLPAAADPLFSYNNGIFSGPITLDIFTTTPGTNIYYTTDGSMATTASTLYQNPIAIDSTTSIRAICTGPNNSPSKNVTRMYIIDDYHTFPIVYLTFDPFDFYDPTTGIYVNYLENWERPASLAFFEKDGSLAFNQPADVEIQGTGSAEFPHKSVGIKAANFNGEALFDFPIFPELPYDKYGSFTLRNSGQDWDKTIFRDAYATSLVSDLSDIGSIIGSPRLYLQSYRPTIAYFNGEYRGIYNIRERLDKRYIKTHFGLDEGEYDFIKDLDEVKSGDLDDWYNYLDFILATDMNVQTNYDSLQKVMDVDEYIDYITFNIYINNTDWPSNNNRRWKEKENGKWRWMVYDLDYTFSLYNSDGSWNSGDYSDNALNRLYNDTGWEWPNPEWSTRPFRACVQNDAWRTQFINRMADQLNVLFTPDRLNVRLQEFIDRYEPEITEHQCKWFDCFNDWDQDINKLESFIGGRTDVVRTHFVEKYPEIIDTITVGITANPVQGGTIEFSTLTLDHDYFPWQGVYFKGVDIPVKAIPADGYEFIGWSDASLGSNPETSVNITSTTYNLTANFQLIVGLNELAQNANVSISPNPTSDVIHIQSELLEGQPVTINLVDITGKIVYYKEISAFPQGNHTIGAAHFPKGTYSLNITNQEGIKLVTSVIIQ